MGRVAFITFAFLLFRAVLWGADCTPLTFGEQRSFSLQSKKTSCISLSIPDGQAWQLVVEQPVDLELDVDGRTLDSFEFGSETGTFPAGQYSIRVRSVEEIKETIASHVSISSVSLPEAEKWRAAEEAATKSKLSGKLEDIDRSAELWQNLNENLAVARTFLKRGDALYDGNSADARNAYEKALGICRANHDARCTGEAANNSGQVSIRMAEFEPAVSRLAEAADSFREVKDFIDLGKTESNLGTLYRQVGDFQKAISLGDDAASLLQGRDEVAFALVENNLGMCYQRLGEYEKAKLYFERAIEIEVKDAQLHPKNAGRVAVPRANLGENYSLEEKFSPAENMLKIALTEAISAKAKREEAQVRSSLGILAWKQRKLDEARSELEAALKIHQELGDRRVETTDLNYLGECDKAQGDFIAARQHFTQAKDLRLQIGLRDAAADSLFSLARLDFETGNFSEARQLAEQALTLQEAVRSRVPGPNLRASFYAQKQKNFDLLLAIAMLPSNPNATRDGLLAVERGHGRAILDLLAEGSVLSGAPKDLLERRDSIQQQIDFLSTRLSTSKPKEDELRRRIELLVAQDDEVEAQVRESVQGQKFGKPLDSLETLQRNLLPENAALLEFHLGEQSSDLWVVERDLLRHYKLPGRPVIEDSANSVTELFGKVLERKRSPLKQAQFDESLAGLSQDLLGVIDVELPQKLIIVPDRVLNRIPFAALWMKGQKRLGIEHEIIQVPNAEFLESGRRPKQLGDFPQTFLAFADPVFSANDSRLDHLRHDSGDPVKGFDTALPRLMFAGELDAVAAEVPKNRRRTLRGFDANTEALKTLNLTDYGILHFSTHALIDDQMPEASRIALSMLDKQGHRIDGFVRPYQLSSLKLDGSVVVLSACDTALGKEVIGEGLVGFTASFIRAGASQLLMTLSEVDAEASSAFLSAVYHTYLSSDDKTRKGITLEESVKRAQEELAKSRRWSDPYYWASFSLYGIPSIATSYN